MDNKTLNTVLSVLTFLLIVAGIVISARIMAGYEAAVGPAITLSMVLIGVGGGVALLFGIFQLVTNLKKNLRLLIALALFALIAFICYSIADDTVLRSYPEATTASGVKFSEAGIYVMYVLVIGAALTAIISEVSRIFK